LGGVNKNFKTRPYTRVQLFGSLILNKIDQCDLDLPRYRGRKEKDMAVRMLQILIGAVSLVSLQGCFFSHTKETTIHDRPDSQTTTVYQHPGDDTVVTTTH